MRRPLLLVATLLLAACGTGDDSPAPVSKGDGGVDSQGPGDAFPMSNVAYLPTHYGTTSPIYVYDFGKQAFLDQPLITVEQGSGFTGLAISADGRTLYVDRATAVDAVTYQVDAYALDAPGATLLGSVPCAVWDADVVVPQPDGTVLVYSGVPASSVVQEDATLEQIVSPSVSFSYPINGIAYSTPDPSNGNQYVTDTGGNFYVVHAGAVMGSLQGVVSSSVDLPNGVDLPSLVAPGGGVVYAFGEVTGGNTVQVISVANPAAPAVMGSVVIPDRNVDAMLTAKTSSNLYVVTHSAQSDGSVTNDLTVVTPATLAAAAPVVLASSGGFKAFALSPDGVSLLATSNIGPNGGITVFATATGAQVASAAYPMSGANVLAPISAQNVVTF